MLLVRQWTAGDTQHILERSPYNAKYLEGLDEKARDDAVAANRFLLVTIVSGAITARTWFRDFPPARDAFTAGAKSLIPGTDAKKALDTKLWSPLAAKRDRSAFSHPLVEASPDVRTGIED